jgi:hypothetical protein
MFRTLETVMDGLYPTRTWGEPDDLARFGAGICEHDGLAIAEELATELDAPTFFREGGADEYCDYIYVLCLGRAPCLVQMRDFEVPFPAELDGEPIREQYLRVCLSSMARVAGVQQIAMDLDTIEGDRVISERPRAGVYDAPLLPRFQRLVAILPAYDITHLDFGEISAPPPGYSNGRYAELYGGEPHTSNYVFFPQPATMCTTTIVPRIEN